MDPPEVLKLLESNHPETVEEAKKKLHEHFNGSKYKMIFLQFFDCGKNFGD